MIDLGTTSLASASYAQRCRVTSTEDSLHNVLIGGIGASSSYTVDYPCWESLHAAIDSTLGLTSVVWMPHSSGLTVGIDAGLLGSVITSAFGIYRRGSTEASSPAISLMPIDEQADLADATTRPQALSAIADLERWLSLSGDSLADLADVAPRTIAYWRSGTNPHRSSIRSLMMAHSFVASLVRNLGLSEARLWLGRPLEDGRSRQDAMMEPGGVSNVIREARDVLFSRREPTALLPDEEYADQRVVPRDTSVFSVQSRQVQRRA